MKALIISDKQEIIDTLSEYLSEQNYDIIVYRWLLKALDNIEEIHPDMIFLSANEYPRHWKTLASFVQSGIGGNEIKLYLYDPEPLNDDDVKKAEQLGISAFIDSLSNDELKKILPNKNINVVKPKKYEIILTHPESGRFIFGTACLTEPDIYECRINISDKDLQINQYIRYVSVCNNEELLSFEANVIDKDEKDNRIVLKVKDYYEEEI